MYGNFVIRLVVLLVVQSLIFFGVRSLFPDNALVIVLLSTALISAFMSYINLPPQFRRDFYRQPMFVKSATIYFIVLFALYYFL